MFSISFPDSCRKERSWICAVLLGEFLGLEHDIRFDNEDSIRISAEGKMLELSDAFFKNASANWLLPETLPSRPLKQWLVPDSGFLPRLVKPSVPVIFGRAGFEMHNGKALLGPDIFGSAFFMLSRYEEAVNKQRDIHDRFPASASLAYREGFLDRPIIDEYVEILWSAITRLWPQVTRRQHVYKTVVSCDVDQPYHPSAISFYRMARNTVGRMVRSRSLTGACNPALNYLGGRHRDLRHDPYYNKVNWIMDVNEKAGNVVAFNFIPEITNPAFDGICQINDPAVVAMFKRIDVRQHKIGIHPGYNTYQSVERTRSGLNKLLNVLCETHIDQQVTGGRNHYLRWSTKTPAVWEATGLRYDSTLSYADHAGFRCGTCREYAMFDLHAREPLRIKQRPLICMDGSVVIYMGYGLTEEAFAEIEKLKKAAHKVQGNFTLLWHNSFLEEKCAQTLYCDAIK